VDPTTLPNHGDVSSVRGNAPTYIKQLIYNTYIAYGVGDSQDCFGHGVGRAVRFVEMDVGRGLTFEGGDQGGNALDFGGKTQGRMEARTVAEVEVTRRESQCSV